MNLREASQCHVNFASDSVEILFVETVAQAKDGIAEVLQQRLFDTEITSSRQWAAEGREIKTFHGGKKVFGECLVKATDLAASSREV